jgi:transmembrane sensor
VSEGGEEGSMGIDRWAEALTWHTTLREADEKELTHAVGRQWQDWYADAENRRAFDNVSRLLDDRPLYRNQRRRTKAELEEDQYDLSVPIAEWRRARATREIRRERSSVGKWWWLSGGAIAVATLAAIAVLFTSWPLRFGSGGRPASPVVYQTDVGGLKDVYLNDGSSITLGGRTKVSVAFSAQRRSVSLIEGQAWFKVAHKPHWPFVVAAGDGTITDVGTAFMVTRESDRVVVTVTEGAVEVSARRPVWSVLRLDRLFAPKPVLTPIRVSRGEELAFGDNGALSAVKPTDTHAATAWTHGRLTFDDQPLRYVIETVDRYSSRHIVVSPSAGALRFSGIVFDDEIEDWLQSLQAIFPVTVEEQGADVRIHMRNPTPATLPRAR